MKFEIYQKLNIYIWYSNFENYTPLKTLILNLYYISMFEIYI
jgi:hypothetical protein